MAKFSELGSKLKILAFGATLEQYRVGTHVENRGAASQIYVWNVVGSVEVDLVEHESDRRLQEHVLAIAQPKRQQLVALVRPQLARDVERPVTVVLDQLEKSCKQLSS
jgi:hypothetical protein